MVFCYATIVLYCECYIYIVQTDGCVQPATFQLAGLPSYLSTLAYLPTFQLATFHVAVNVFQPGGAGRGRSSRAMQPTWAQICLRCLTGSRTMEAGGGSWCRPTPTTGRRRPCTQGEFKYFFKNISLREPVRKKKILEPTGRRRPFLPCLCATAPAGLWSQAYVIMFLHCLVPLHLLQVFGLMRTYLCFYPVGVPLQCCRFLVSRREVAKLTLDRIGDHGVDLAKIWHVLHTTRVQPRLCVPCSISPSLPPVFNLAFFATRVQPRLLCHPCSTPPSLPPVFNLALFATHVQPRLFCHPCSTSPSLPHCLK